MTPFGQKIRQLRKDRDVSLKDMAEAIGVSAPYLSALEHGHRSRPSWYLIQRIIAYFNVIWDEAEEMQKLARLSHPKISIDTSGLSPKATKMTNMLSEHIDKLSPDNLDEIIEIIEIASKE